MCLCVDYVTVQCNAVLRYLQETARRKWGEIAFKAYSGQTPHHKCDYWLEGKGMVCEGACVCQLVKEGFWVLDRYRGVLHLHVCISII